MRRHTRRRRNSPAGWPRASKIGHVYAMHPPFSAAPAGRDFPEPQHGPGGGDHFAAPDASKRFGAGASSRVRTGAALTRFELSSKEAGAGEAVAVHLPLAPRPTRSRRVSSSLALIPKRETPEGVAHRSNDDVRLIQGFLLLYGQWGLPASPPGTAYEQHGTLFIPSNAPQRCVSHRGRAEPAGRGVPRRYDQVRRLVSDSRALPLTSTPARSRQTGGKHSNSRVKT